MAKQLRSMAPNRENKVCVDIHQEAPAETNGFIDQQKLKNGEKDKTPTKGRRGRRKKSSVVLSEEEDSDEKNARIIKELSKMERPKRASARQAAAAVARTFWAEDLRTSTRLRSSCERCGQMFRTVELKEDHIIQCVLGMIEQLEQETKPPPMPFTCTDCPMGFKSRRSLQRHCTSEHPTKDKSSTKDEGSTTDESPAAAATTTTADVAVAAQNSGNSLDNQKSSEETEMEMSTPIVKQEIEEEKEKEETEVVEEEEKSSPEPPIKKLKNNHQEHESIKSNNSSVQAEMKNDDVDDDDEENCVKIEKMDENCDQDDESSSVGSTDNNQGADKNSSFKHTPMYGGIVVVGALSYRELRRQESLVRRTCTYCGKVCPKPSDLQRHLMKHTGERPFGCESCGRKFKAKRSLQYHLRSAHGAVVDLSPALHDKLTSTRKYRDRSAEKWTSSNGIGKNNGLVVDVENVDNMNNSSNNNNNTPAFSGDCSSIPNPNADPILSGSEPQTEPVDLTDGERSRNHQNHSNHNHQNQNEISEMTSTIPVSSSSVVYELMQANGFTSPISPPTPPPLIGHQNDNSSPPTPPPPAADDDGVIEEEEDDDESQVFSVASFKGNDGKTPQIVKYKVHPRSEEIIATRLEGVNISTGEKAFLYKCHWCSKIFLALSKLQAHLTVHSRRSRKVFSCEKCGEIFKLRSQYRLHQVTHFNPHSLMAGLGYSNHLDIRDEDRDDVIGIVNKFQNSININSAQQQPSSSADGKESDSTEELDSRPTSSQEEADSRDEEIIGSDLNGIGLASKNCNTFSPGEALQELKYHEEVMRYGYRCGICGKAFDRPFSLHRHERIHTGVKPCYCKDCGRGFSEPRNLRHHIIRFHSDGSQRHLLRRNRLTPNVNTTVPSATISPKTMVSLLRDQKITLPSLLAHGEEFLDSAGLLRNDESGATVTPKDSPSEPWDASIKKTNKTVHIPKEELEGIDDVDRVTVIYPTDVPDSEPLEGEEYSMADFWDESCGRTTIRRTDTFENGKEILSDPKRSLIGNRRKQKPHKVVPKVKSEVLSIIKLEEKLSDASDKPQQILTEVPPPPPPPSNQQISVSLPPPAKQSQLKSPPLLDSCKLSKLPRTGSPTMQHSNNNNHAMLLTQSSLSPAVASLLMSDAIANATAEGQGQMATLAAVAEVVAAEALLQSHQWVNNIPASNMVLSRFTNSCLLRDKKQQNKSYLSVCSPR